MALNWINNWDDISIDSLLLLEDCQIGWLNWLGEDYLLDEWGAIFRAHPYIAFSFKQRNPDRRAWVERASASGTLQATRETELKILRFCEDFMVYALAPEIYHRLPHNNWDERELRALCDWAGKRVIDIGTGTGKQAKIIAPLCRVLYCVEPVGALRRYLRALEIPGMYVVDGLMTRLPFEDEFADVMTSGHVFGAQPKEELRECFRVLKKGGMLILIPGNVDEDNDTHQFLLEAGFEWSRFSEPGDSQKRKYWKVK